MLRRTFLSLSTLPILAKWHHLWGVVDIDAITKEANEIFRRTWEQSDQSWRKRCRISYVLDYARLCRVQFDDDRISRYGRMVNFTKDEIKSGEYRNRIEDMAKRAVANFNRLIELAAAAGEPYEVTFFDGGECPVASIATCDKPSEYYLIAHHDFGISRT
jgi:hypothetical protein